MEFYESWLVSEKEWIKAYCRRVFRRSLFLVTPLVVLLLAALFGGMTLAGGGSAEDACYSALGGALIGLFVCSLYLLLLLLLMRPGKFVRKIRSSVKKLGLTETEKEMLGREMLETDDRHRISFEMVGPGSDHTPARFVLTPHFAFLEGSCPYSILVRLSDIAGIWKGEERKTVVTRGAKVKRYQTFTLYRIDFYRKDQKGSRRLDGRLPDISMGFFDVSVRDQAMRLLEETGID